MIKLDVKDSVAVPGYFSVRVIVNDTTVNLGNVSKNDLEDITDDLMLDLQNALTKLD